VSQRRAVLGFLLAVATAVPLTACGLEAQDETSREHSQVQAADFAVGGVQVRDAYLTYASTTGAPVTTGTTTTIPAPATTAFLVVSFVNDGTGPDALTGVDTPGATVTLGGTTSGGALPLPKGVLVAVGAPGAGSTGGPTLSYPVTGSPAPVGTSVPFRFTFAGAGSSPTIRVPVVPAGETTQPTRSLPSLPAPSPSATGERSND
jgi:hypothetical protein